MPEGWDDLIAAAQYRTVKVMVCARGDLVTRKEQLVDEFDRATQAARSDRSLGGNSEAARLAAAIVDVETEIQEASIEVVMSAVSRRAWADALAANPPSKSDRLTGLDHDPHRFPVAAVALCAKTPALTLEQAERLADVLTTAEWSKLWMAALTLNVVGLDSPKFTAATELLLANGHSSTTPPPAASPEAPSLAGSGEQSPSTSTTTEDASSDP